MTKPTDRLPVTDPASPADGTSHPVNNVSGGTLPSVVDAHRHAPLGETEAGRPTVADQPDAQQSADRAPSADHIVSNPADIGAL